MARITISGIDVEYELLGKEGDPAVAITPGGRFPKDHPGVTELGEVLAAGGRRVLLWDRPNCGASDISFDGINESELHGHVLTTMIRELNLGPTVLSGGSAGARVSLIAASRDPEIVSHLVIWWISGGVFGLLNLGHYYCSEHASAANKGGMAAVAALPQWAEQIERNPKNRDILMAMDPKKFIETMERWAMFFVPSEDTPVPGMLSEDFARLTMPTRIFRSGTTDFAHPRRTSEWTHEMIPGSELIDPPWGDNEWNERGEESAREGQSLIFQSWPKMAPLILDFTKK